MPDTLKSRTARSALFLLRENLRDLRAYAEDFDPEEIDRLVKAADLVSTSLKKLQAWVAEEPKNDVAPAPEDGEAIDVLQLSAFLDAVSKDRLCLACGGLLPSAPE